jgi:HlyD family secretion protein
MRNRILFALAILGVLVGIVSAYIYGIRQKPQPPAFAPASNPYDKGIYAVGIVETLQGSGENIDIYPEVAGTVVRIPVAEGQRVKAGSPLLALDDTVQRATAGQLKGQMEAAQAQITLAQANLKSLQDQLDKQQASHDLDPRSVSSDALDTATNAVEVAKANLEVARKQYLAAEKSWQAANALLEKYTIKAASDSTVLSINTAIGSYISSQGTYDSYTGGVAPALVLGSLQDELAVRCYVDEVLIGRMPDPSQMEAHMFIKGTDVNIPMKFVRVQPYVQPKIQLSNQRTERVDVRVLPVIFRFDKQKGLALFPGQLVDVYIGEQKTTAAK